MKATFRTIGIKSLDEVLDEATKCMESIEQGDKVKKTASCAESSLALFKK